MRGQTTLPGSFESMVAGRGAACAVMAGRLIIVAIVVCALGVADARADVRDGGSPFTITQETVPTVHHSPSVLSEVMASWSPSAFDAIDVGSSFDIPLGAGESVLALIHTTGTTFGGANYWVGELVDRPGSSVLIVSRAGMLAGDIRDPELGVFWLRPAGDDRPREVRIQQVDPDAQFQCGVNDDAIVKQPVGQAPAESAFLGTPIIDIIVFYTAQARDAALGTLSMEVIIESHVIWSNTAYINSNINAELRLVKMSEVDYVELTDYGQMLDDFDAGFLDDSDIPPGPGEFGATGCQIDWYGADLAALLVSQDGEYEGLPVSGIANGLTDPDGDITRAYSVMVYNATSTFTHEVGHCLGCCHAVGDSDDCDNERMFSYSVGHRFTANSFLYRTIMAYSPGYRIQNFSNPDVDYLGEPTGVPIGQPEEAHNAATINLTAPVVSQYRDGFTPFSFHELASPGGGVWGNDVYIDSAGIAAGRGPVGGKFFGNCGIIGHQLSAGNFAPGEQVAISGNIRIQSARSTSGPNVYGRIQVFDGTTHIITLVDPTPGTPDWMGIADIDIDGDVIVAPAGVLPGQPRNFFYIFRHNDIWELEAEIVVSGLVGGVAVHGDRVAVANSKSIGGGNQAEAILVYRYNYDESLWELEQNIVRSGSLWPAFDVDMDGDRLIVSARQNQGNAGVNGATIYRLNPDAPDGLKWRWEAHLAYVAVDTGSKVGIHGNLAVIGDLLSARARVMEFDNDLQAWIVAPSILNPNPGDFDRFGKAVAVHGSTIVASDYGSNRAVYAFKLPGISSAVLPCDLSINNDPVDAAVEAGEDAIFSITASGFHELIYRWRKDGVQINDADPNLYSGTTTPTLTVVSAQESDQGSYDALVFFDGCLVASDPATLTITCTGDIDGSGDVGVNDLLVLLGTWGPCKDCPADFDNSGDVGVNDLLVLLGSWGPCK